MCIPVRPKNVAGNWGTVSATFLYSAAASWPGTAGNIGSVSPSAISLLHSRPWRMTNAVPHAIVARSHSVLHRDIGHVQGLLVLACLCHPEVITCLCHAKLLTLVIPSEAKDL